MMLSAAAGLLTPPVHARSAPSPGSTTYLLGPGDVLSLTVAGYPEFNQPSITVPPDGLISLPTLGTIRVAGRTRLAVQNELRDLLIKRVRMRNPSLALSIAAVRPPLPLFVGRVIVAGDVPRPGSFPIRRKQRLSDLLAEAGVTERLEEKTATLVRGEKTFALNLFGAAKTPGSAFDLSLRPGDSIAVRVSTPGTITITGAVTRPGTYELHRTPRSEFEIGAAPRLSDLLTRAGWQAARGGDGEKGRGGELSPGVSPPLPLSSSPLLAAWTGTLQRAGRTLPIHPDAALARIGGGDDLPLKAGDFISVAQVPPIKVLVDGLVTRPNTYLLAPQTSVLELLTQAGGLTRPAGDILASVRRGNQLLPLDLSALLLSSDASANLALQDGDYVQLRAPETLEIQVAGQVAKPGAIQVKPGATILDALTQAGGLAEGLTPADTQLRLLRKESDGSQKIISADAVGIFTLTDASTNAVLQKGDFLQVTKSAANTVFITGEVTTPNSYTLREGEGLPQLITRAGGAKDTAALTKITVSRGGKVIPLDAYEAVRNNAPLDFTLQQGDQVIVPQNQNLVAVQGAVSKTGYFPIPEKGTLTLQQALTAAGLGAGAQKLIVSHARADGYIDPKQAKEIKIVDLLRGKATNITLQPRDVVYVEPPKNSKSLLDTVAQLSVFRLFF